MKYSQVKNLFKKLPEHDIFWISRESNLKANQLAQSLIYGNIVQKGDTNAAIEEEQIVEEGLETQTIKIGSNGIGGKQKKLEEFFKGSIKDVNATSTELGERMMEEPSMQAHKHNR